MYKVFVRNWWKDHPTKKGELIPNSGGRKTTLRTCSTLKEAQQFCKEYNESHNPGKYSRKAEFTAY